MFYNSFSLVNCINHRRLRLSNPGCEQMDSMVGNLIHSTTHKKAKEFVLYSRVSWEYVRDLVLLATKKGSKKDKTDFFRLIGQEQI